MHKAQLPERASSACRPDPSAFSPSLVIAPQAGKSLFHLRRPWGNRWSVGANTPTRGPVAGVVNSPIEFTLLIKLLAHEVPRDKAEIGSVLPELAGRHAAIVGRLVNGEPLLARNIETKDRQLLAKSFDLVLQGNVGFRSVHLDLHQRVPDHPATVRAVPEPEKSTNGLSGAAVAKASQLASQRGLFVGKFVLISTSCDRNSVASRPPLQAMTSVIQKGTARRCLFCCRS